MLHIGVLTTSFPQDISGSEAAGSFVYDFVNELANHVEVTVFAPGTSQSAEETEKFRVYRYYVPHLPLSTLKAGNPAHWLSIFRTLRSGESTITHMAGENHFDHLFALWAIPSGYWARKVKRKYGIHYSIWALGSDIWSMRDKPVTGTILKKILQDAEHCFADGQILKEDVRQISGRSCHFLPSSRILVTGETSSKNSGPPYNLAYLGRWHPNKGIDILLKSLESLDEADWGSINELRIFGGGPLENEVTAAIDEFKSRGRPVLQGGYINKAEAARLISWADYLLIPSRIESIPVVFSDALQCHTPVVAMPVGDLPELISRSNCGILAGNVSPEAFSAAIKTALKTSATGYRESIEKLSSDFNMQSIVRNFIETVNKTATSDAVK